VRCCGYDEFFDARMARIDATRYRKRGLRRSAVRILEHARSHGLRNASVLEIGGGIGALSLELVRAGAAHATTVELSPGYEQEAISLAAESGVGDRVERRLADVAAGDEVPEADVVVLERVVCCYPDAPALVGAAGARAGRLLVLSYPRYGIVSRLVIGACNGVQRLRHRTFRAYVHRPQLIHAAAAGAGLQPVDVPSGLVWRVAAYERVYPTAA
jgi:hypothetical protein